MPNDSHCFPHSDRHRLARRLGRRGLTPYSTRRASGRKIGGLFVCGFLPSVVLFPSGPHLSAHVIISSLFTVPRLRSTLPSDGILSDKIGRKGGARSCFGSIFPVPGRPLGRGRGIDRMTILCYRQLYGYLR